MNEKLIEIGKAAKEAAFTLLRPAQRRTKALEYMSKELLADTPFILEENAIDVQNARAKGITRGHDRPAHADQGAYRSHSERALKGQSAADPLSEGTLTLRPNGLNIQKVRVPLGVIGIIYEARPNVTADAAALCLKSGNAVILRGGQRSHPLQSCN